MAKPLRDYTRDIDKQVGEVAYHFKKMGITINRPKRRRRDGESTDASASEHASAPEESGEEFRNVDNNAPHWPASIGGRRTKTAKMTKRFGSLLQCIHYS